MITAIYLRVSTSDQSTDSQEHELSGYCQRQGWKDTQTFRDQISGAKLARTGFDALMTAVRAGKVRRVVVYKLDRLGRSLSHLALILEELQRHAVALVAPGQQIDTSESNPAGRLQLHVLMAVAEFERGMIRERVNAGLASAKARGVKLGRRAKHKRTPAEVQLLRGQGKGVRAIGRELGIPASSVSAMLKAA